MNWDVTTPPTLEPITLEEVKAQLRREDSDEDAHLDLLIITAREFCEGHIELALLDQEITAFIDAFSSEIVLPRANLLSVTSITYIDSSGDSQTVPNSTYQVHTGKRGFVSLAQGEEWPVDLAIQRLPITVTYRAGFGVAREDVPKTIKHAMKVLITHWDNNREALVAGSISKEMELSVGSLLSQHRRYGV